MIKTHKEERMFNNTILQCTFEMHPDVIQQERSVYTVWDLFGDVGGLFDMLSYIGQWLVGLISLVSGSPLNRFIFARLFMLEGKASETSSKRWRNENQPILALVDGCCSVAEIGSKDTFRAKLKTVSRKNLTSSTWSKVRWSVALQQSFSSQRQNDSS